MIIECDDRLDDGKTAYTNKRKNNVTKRRGIVDKNMKRSGSRPMSFVNKLTNSSAEPYASYYLDQKTTCLDKPSSLMDVTDFPSTATEPLVAVICSSRRSSKTAGSSDHKWNNLPNEILLKIFTYIGMFNADDGDEIDGDIIRSTILAMRSVCRSWNCVVQNTRSLLACFSSITANRFIISHDTDSNEYRLCWSSYRRLKSRTLVLREDDIKAARSLGFSFSRLGIVRIVFQELKRDTLNDEFVAYICSQFLRCRKFAPMHLCIRDSSMAALSSSGLHSLLSVMATDLEVFEVSGVTGLRPDSITDAHLSKLNISKLRRFIIECTKFKNHNREPPISLLEISDRTLEKFARCGYFPMMALERCKVTVNGVVQYVEKWLVNDVEAANQILHNVSSHSFTLCECPAVSDDTFRRECRRRSLDFKEDLPIDASISNISSGTNSIASSRRNSAESDSISYNIYRMKDVKEFLFTLSPSSDYRSDYEDIN